MKALRSWLVAALISAAMGTLFTTSAPAFRLNGTSTTAAYVQQVAKPGTQDDFENRTRVYERLRIDLFELGNPGLTLHTYGTLSNVVSDQNIGDTRTRLYNAYLQYQPVPRGERSIRCDVRAGRQWVSSGVGSGTMDGLAVKIDRSAWGGVTLFGGTLGIDTHDQLRFDSPKDSRRWGGELRVLPRLTGAYEPELAVSFADTRRNDLEENRRLGARAALRVHRELRIWSELRHDFLLDRTYGTAAGIEYMKPSKLLRIWGEYNRRTPALPATSFFSVWDTKPVSEIRGGIGIRVTGPYRFIADFDRTDFRAQTSYVDIGGTEVSRSKVDRATSYRFVIDRGWAQAGVRFSNGFAGDRTGLVASVNQDFCDRLNVSLDLGYESYNYGPTSYEDNTAASGILAVACKVARDTNVTAQVEALNNRDLKQDVRLLARVDQRFRLGR